MTAKDLQSLPNRPAHREVSELREADREFLFNFFQTAPAGDECRFL